MFTHNWKVIPGPDLGPVQTPRRRLKIARLHNRTELFLSDTGSPGSSASTLVRVTVQLKSRYNGSQRNFLISDLVLAAPSTRKSIKAIPIETVKLLKIITATVLAQNDPREARTRTLGGPWP